MKKQIPPSRIEWSKEVFAYGMQKVYAYYDEETDAAETEAQVRKLGTQCLPLCRDLKNPDSVKRCVAQTGQVLYPNGGTIVGS